MNKFIFFHMYKNFIVALFFKIFIGVQFLLEYRFTMLCQFLLYSKMNQLYIYIYPLFFRFFFHIGHYRVLSRVPCAIQQVLNSYLFYIWQCVYVNPNLPIYPSPTFPPGNHKFVSTSVTLFLQISSFVSFFQNPHISDSAWYLSFSV